MRFTIENSSESLHWICTEGFVCPVLVDPGNAPAHSDAIVTIGEGHYTVGPSTTAHPTVPVHATNGNGAGTPPGPHATPGDTDYTAIWAAQ